jgi:hypothetical protein
MLKVSDNVLLHWKELLLDCWELRSLGNSTGKNLLESEMILGRKR